MDEKKKKKKILDLVLYIYVWYKLTKVYFANNFFIKILKKKKKNLVDDFITASLCIGRKIVIGHLDSILIAGREKHLFRKNKEKMQNENTVKPIEHMELL